MRRCRLCKRKLTRDIHKLHDPQYAEQYKDEDVCTSCWKIAHREEVKVLKMEAAAAAF